MSCNCGADTLVAEGQPTGENRLLHVAGTCDCPTTGYTLRLEHDNPGINPDPTLVVLRLVEKAPELGENTMTPTPVEFETEISNEATTVVVRQGERSFTIPIVDPS